MLSVGRHAKVTVYGKREGRETRFRVGAKNSKECSPGETGHDCQEGNLSLESGGELETGRQSQVLMVRPPCSHLRTSHFPLRLRTPEKRQPLVPELNIILGTCSLLALDSLHRAHCAVPRV